MWVVRPARHHALLDTYIVIVIICHDFFGLDCFPLFWMGGGGYFCETLCVHDVGIRHYYYSPLHVNLNGVSMRQSAVRARESVMTTRVCE